MSEKIIKNIVKRLKIDNTKNMKSAIKQNMVNWTPQKVKRLVEIYLDSVLRLYKERLKT